MKSLLLFLLVVLFALPTFAQKDVTTFLGIPVDGTKAEVGRSLIEKGFSRTVVDEREFFEGDLMETASLSKLELTITKCVALWS